MHTKRYLCQSTYKPIKYVIRHTLIGFFYSDFIYDFVLAGGKAEEKENARRRQASEQEFEEHKRAGKPKRKKAPAGGGL